MTATATDPRAATPDEDDLTGTTMAILNAAVESVVGPGAAPRPGQAMLTEDIAAAYAATGEHLGKAPTGSGKSFASLAPAFAAVATRRQRSVLSTESISLQTQINDKDAPVVADATYQVTGYRPTWSVLKGFSNYVCLHAATVSAAGLTGDESLVDDVDASARAVRGAGNLLEWALTLDRSAVGDRHSYGATVEEFKPVSTTSNACTGTACPLYEACFPYAAKMRAFESDVVIVNHALLAVQAATGAPVILGNEQLGSFDHLIIDEAHALPDTVRSQGASSISVSRVNAMAARSRAAISPLCGSNSKEAIVASAGFSYAKSLGYHLEELADGQHILDLAGVEAPLGELGEDLENWAKTLSKTLRSASKQAVGPESWEARALAAEAGDLARDVGLSATARPGVARWIEAADRLSISPVGVSAYLKNNLYRAGTDPDTGESPERSVTCISATLGKNAGWELGLEVREPTPYPSPFTAAFENSLVYYWQLTDTERTQLFGARSGSSPKADSKARDAFTVAKVVDLVGASAGSALVLAATSAAGQAYADALRKKYGGRFTIYSQWDKIGASEAVRLFKADRTSVLVGTKSLMTGVDASGATCRLVVINRAPRRPANPVDDARVELILKRNSAMPRGVATGMVYAEDAASLLSQAAGRLIRSTSDSGVIAFLDDRMVADNPQVYPGPTRKIYAGAFADFPHVTTDIEEVRAYFRNP